MRRAIWTAVFMIGATTAASALSWSLLYYMYRDPVVLPQTRPMTPPPENTVPVGGPHILSRLDARERLTNPLAATPDVLAQGQELYTVYCVMCHGVDGAGDGPLAEHYRRMPALTAPHIANYTGGWVYSIIREGGRNMPPFAGSLSVDERWALVHYTRTFLPSE